MPYDCSAIVMQAGSEIEDINEGKIDYVSDPSLEQVLPPEEGNQPETKKKAVKYGRKADIWSLGMTLCELATGQVSFHSLN